MMKRNEEMQKETGGIMIALTVLITVSLIICIILIAGLVLIVEKAI